jgi:hypothetical protein
MRRPRLDLGFCATEEEEVEQETEEKEEGERGGEEERKKDLQPPFEQSHSP